MSATDRLRLPQHVVTTKIGDEVVLLHLKTRRYYALNETGARVIELLEQQVDPEAIVASISEEWDVESEQAYTEVMNLLAELQAEGLVERA